MPQVVDTNLINDASLVAYYKAENVNDSTTNAFNLTDTGSVAFNAAKFNNGFDFGTPNTTKHLNTTSKLGIDGGAISISFWAKVTSEITSGIQNIVCHSSNVTDTRTDFYYDYNVGVPRLVVGRTRIGVANDRTNYTGSIADSVFHHYVYAYDAANYLLYVDGVSKGGGASSGSGISTGTDGFAISGDTTATNFFAGVIDDVAVFSRALTAAEVQIIYVGGHFMTPNSKFW